MKKVRGKGAALLTALMLISGCSQQSEENTQLDAQNRVYSDLREGTSEYTLETPYDFPNMITAAGLCPNCLMGINTGNFRSLKVIRPS